MTRATSPQGTVDAPADGASAQEQSLEVSFRTFVAARWTALTRYAFLLTGDHQIAEDVVQIALEKCWPRWGQIRASNPESYVRVSVAHTAASRGRRRRHPESSLDELKAQASHLIAALTAPGDLAEDQAVRVGLWLALTELPPRRRAVVVLRLWEDRSEADTAHVLGISVGAVKSQLSKALQQMRLSTHARELLETSQGER